MTSTPSRGSKSSALGILLVLLGIAAIALGWVVPSRFNSIPIDVLHEASTPDMGLAEYAYRSLADQNLGAAELFLKASESIQDDQNEAVSARLEEQVRSNPTLARWGSWDPFLSAALDGIALEEYSDQPGALGVVIANPTLEALNGFLESSRNPFVAEVLSTGELATYRRLFPVYSSSGRPLEATLLVTALLVQGDRFHPDLRQELRMKIWEAKSSGSAIHVEDVYLDLLSLSRMFDFGQLKALLSSVRSLDTLMRLRYAFHRRPDGRPTLFAASVISENPKAVMDYLGLYGDEGVDGISMALKFGKGGLELLLREQLPLEESADGKYEASGSPFAGEIAAFCLVNPNLSLVIKYSLFFLGTFLLSWGSSFFALFYREKVSPALAVSQRIFVSMASVVVFVVLSEPNLASGNAYEGFSFRFVMPVLAVEDGEIVITETEPTTAMDPSTLISVAFFFLLQALVFLICLLKVREIDRKEVNNLVKLKLMENEENLFDTGLYVGIAGTCISLVLQVLGMIEGNLLAAYASNLFGILCVAIVKIRLVRPFKNKLILASEELMATLGANKA